MAVTIILITVLISAAARTFLANVLRFSTEDSSTYASILEAVGALVGMIFVAIQIRADTEGEQHGRLIEEQQFLFEYNKAFIENSNMTEVESLLEAYDRHEIEPGKLFADTNRQKIVNYLVYLEGLAPLVLDEIMKFEKIDDLMAYRFFLAVNNPDVQREELFPFSQYYYGCFKLYEMWAAWRKGMGLKLHNEKTALSKDPRYQLVARNAWLGTSDPDLRERLLADMPNTVDNRLMVDIPCADELGRVGELLYLVDPYIYPAVFGEKPWPDGYMDRVMETLASTPGSPFSLEDIRVVRMDQKVVGIIVFHRGAICEPFAWQDIDAKSLGLPNSFPNACEHYFDEVYADAGEGKAIISCLATDPDYRGRGIASALLDQVVKEAVATGCSVVLLDALEENKSATALYERRGFVVFDEVDGYAYGMEKRPRVVRMRRDVG